MNILPDRLSDLSTAEESGHREIDQVRVNEFVDLFRSGRYGRGLLRGPGVIRGMTDGSGKMLLEDGKHTVSALPPGFHWTWILLLLRTSWLNN